MVVVVRMENMSWRKPRLGFKLKSLVSVTTSGGLITPLGVTSRRLTPHFWLWCTGVGRPDLIRSYSHEGDLVMDPFMGSGTTARMRTLLVVITLVWDHPTFHKLCEEITEEDENDMTSKERVSRFVLLINNRKSQSDEGFQSFFVEADGFQNLSHNEWQTMLVTMLARHQPSSFGAIATFDHEWPRFFDRWQHPGGSNLLQSFTRPQEESPSLSNEDGVPQKDVPWSCGKSGMMTKTSEQSLVLLRKGKRQGL